MHTFQRMSFARITGSTMGQLLLFSALPFVVVGCWRVNSDEPSTPISPAAGFQEDTREPGRKQLEESSSLEDRVAELQDQIDLHIGTQEFLLWMMSNGVRTWPRHEFAHDGPFWMELQNARQHESETHVTRYRRWQFVLHSQSDIDLEHLAMIYDQLGIEIGLISLDAPGLMRVSNLGQERPTQVRVNPKLERCMTIHAHPGIGWLLSDRGMEYHRCVILELIPVDLQNELALMEMDVAEVAGHTVADVASTVFDVRRTEDGDYTPTVVEQQYLGNR